MGVSVKPATIPRENGHIVRCTHLYKAEQVTAGKEFPVFVTLNEP